METHFSKSQLKNPRLGEAEAILRRCVHCGLCTATCPTYVLLGDERDSPRGRIYLMKQMFEQNRPGSAEIRTHLDRCLSCLSCMTTCPGGVDYVHLIDFSRAYVETTSRRPLKQRLLRALLAKIVPYPERFRLALLGARLARPFQRLLVAARLKELAAMLAIAPKEFAPRARYKAPAVIPSAKGKRHARVILLRGCAQQVLRPQINDATVRFLQSQGVETVLVKEEGCCGALVHHIGRDEKAADAARRNIDAWEDVMRSGPLDAIVITASGCGSMVKDYGYLLAHDPAYAERAQAISALALDVSEFLVRLRLDAPHAWTEIKIAYHSACSLQHGQRVTQEPRELLRQSGYSVVDIPEGHLCCGSAGTYNLLQPEIAGLLKARKLTNIAKVEPDCVATGNIGCLTQLADGCPVPIVHMVELLDWAYGGPCPEELRHLAGRRHSVAGGETRIAALAASRPFEEV